MEYDGDYYPIKITVKEFHHEDNKLYSVEAVSIDKTEKTAAGRTPPTNEFEGNVQPPAAYYERLSRLVQNVKDFQSSLENDSGLLFQLTRAEEVEEARESVRRGRSREEFIGDRLDGDDGEMPDGVEDEAEAREWLGSVYDEAKGLAERRLTSGGGGRPFYRGHGRGTRQERQISELHGTCEGYSVRGRGGGSGGRAAGWIEGRGEGRGKKQRGT
jgi:hypothetical protein